jgi:hypothetical protein
VARVARLKACKLMGADFSRNSLQKLEAHAFRRRIGTYTACAEHQLLDHIEVHRVCAH